MYEINFTKNEKKFTHFIIAEFRTFYNKLSLLIIFIFNGLGIFLELNVVWTPVIAVPNACKHLYGIGRYDPVKKVFLGVLGVLSAAGGKYAFTLESTLVSFLCGLVPGG